MSDERNWEGASDDELQDGIDDGEPDAMAEYGSRLFQELKRAKALLMRWNRKSKGVAPLASLRYESVHFMGEEREIAALKAERASALREGTEGKVPESESVTSQHSPVPTPVPGPRNGTTMLPGQRCTRTRHEQLGGDHAHVPAHEKEWAIDGDGDEYRCEFVQPNPGSGMGPAKPCRFCIRGRRIYASTATWRGGSGGQTATEDVCNRCWGSGDETKPGPDPRRPPTPERKP